MFKDDPAFLFHVRGNISRSLGEWRRLKFRVHPVLPARKRGHKIEAKEIVNGKSPLPPKKVVSFEELLMSNVYTQEALINLLEAKGIIRKEELLEEIKRLKEKWGNCCPLVGRFAGSFRL